jgi:hypothetical protein
MLGRWGSYEEKCDINLEMSRHSHRIKCLGMAKNLRSLSRKAIMNLKLEDPSYGLFDKHKLICGQKR